MRFYLCPAPPNEADRRIRKLNSGGSDTYWLYTGDDRATTKGGGQAKETTEGDDDAEIKAGNHFTINK